VGSWNFLFDYKLILLTKPASYPYPNFALIPFSLFYTSFAAVNLIRKIFSLLQKYEPLLFALGVVVLLSEVFATTWLITEDAPAHIYNAIITRGLLFDNASVADTIFRLNPVLVPNSLGHAMLSGLTAVFPLHIADKIMHIMLVGGLCFSFRYLALKINNRFPFASWLIFPFVYSGIFYLGFYNFTLGIILALFSTGVWIWARKKNGFLPVLILTVLATLLFFTHLVPFLLFVFLAGIMILFHLIQKDVRRFFTDAGKLLIALVPALVFFILYYTTRTETGSPAKWADAGDVFSRYTRLSHLAVHSEEQLLFTRMLAIVLLVTGVVSFLFFLRTRKKQDAENNRQFVFWGICWTILFVLVFAAPDDFGGSGAMTFRLIEIAWLIFLLFLVAGTRSNKVAVPLAIFGLLIAQININLRKESLQLLSKDAGNVMRLASYIDENSLGAYVPLTGLWLRLHIGELAFAEKKSALLSNYETVHDFFPLKWKEQFPYDYTIGGLSSPDLWCGLCYWPPQPGKPKRNIDYVLICNDSGGLSCYDRLADSLNKYYILKNREFPFELWESKEKAGESRIQNP
jgi:hypothetical protein